MRLSKEHLAWVLEVIADLDWVPRSRVDDIKKSVSRLIGTKTDAPRKVTASLPSRRR